MAIDRKVIAREKEKVNKKALYFLYNPDAPQNETSKEIYIDVIPDSVSHSYSANWEGIDFLGRISPVQIYKNGSDETYTFSIVMHEDILSGSYKGGSIEEFIADIKSLSYPLQASSVIKLPKVYFQLGEISGFGIVNTSVSWNKPFRDGHYVYVTIDFSILIDEDLGNVKLSEILVDNSIDADFVTNSNVISRYTSEEIENIQASLFKYGADFTTGLIDPSDAAGLNEVKLGWATENYDYATTRLTNLYSAFELQGIDVTDISSIKALAETSFSSSIYGATYLSERAYDKKYRNYVNEFNAYFQDYYEDHPEITNDERLAVRDEFYTLIMSIKEISKEAVGYGASN